MPRSTNTEAMPDGEHTVAGTPGKAGYATGIISNDAPGTNCPRAADTLTRGPAVSGIADHASGTKA